MTPDDNLPFKPGAPNPMLGDETDDEWGDDYFRATEAGPGPQPFKFDTCGTQECRNGPTIDPRLLQSQTLQSTPPGSELFTDTAAVPFVDPLSGQIQCSRAET
jgi:hypothetical protein